MTDDEHTPITETELDAIARDPMDFGCLRGIAPTTLRLVAEVRKQRQLLRAVDVQIDDGEISYETRLKIDAYLDRCSR